MEPDAHVPSSRHICRFPRPHIWFCRAISSVSPPSDMVSAFFRSTTECLSVPLRKVFPHVTETLFRYAAALTGRICTYTKSPGHNTLGYKQVALSGRTSESSVKEELKKLENIACFDSRNSVRRTKKLGPLRKADPILYKVFAVCLFCFYRLLLLALQGEELDEVACDYSE